MAILAQCPLCGACFKARDEYAGRRVKCPQCQGVIQIPLSERSPQAVVPIAAKKSPSEEKSSRETLGAGEFFSAPAQDASEATESGSVPVVKPAPVFVSAAPAVPTSSFSPPLLQESKPAIQGVPSVPIWVWMVLASVVSGLVVGLVVYTALRLSGSDQSRGPTAQTEGPKSPGKQTPTDKKKSQELTGSVAAPSQQAGPSKPSKTIREVLDAVVKIETPAGEGKMSIGAGFFIDPRGWVATNYHVIAQGTSATQVRLFDGTQCKVAGILAQEQSMDLAIVKLADPPPRVSVLDISFSGEPELGEEIRVCGHPHNLSFTFVEGTVGRVVTTMELLKERANPLLLQMKTPPDMMWIQHSARIAPGNSGGPVVNKQGQVLGINSFVNELSFGYAIPVRYLRALMALCNDSQVRPLPDQLPSQPSAKPKESPGPSQPPPSAEPPPESPPTPKEAPPSQPPPPQPPASPPPRLGGVGLSPEELQKLYDACCQFFWKPETAEQYNTLQLFARAVSIVKHVQAHPEAAPQAPKEAVAACAQKADQLIAELQKSPWTKEHWQKIHAQAANQLQPDQGALLQGSVVMNAEQIRANQPIILLAAEGIDRKLLLLVSQDHAKLPISTKLWFIGRVVGTAQLGNNQGQTETCPLIQVAYLIKEE